MRRPKKETASTNKPDPAVAELIAAIAEGDEERLRRMVAAGADLQAIDEDGVSVLEHAIRNGSPSVMMSLFSAEPLTDAPEDEERSPEQELAEAIRSGDLKTARRLLEEGASPNQKLPFGMTAVHLAALMQETPILRLLLQEGGDPNIRNETGNTPLFMAETGDDVRALVEAGADANARNELGSTPPLFRRLGRCHSGPGRGRSQGQCSRRVRRNAPALRCECRLCPDPLGDGSRYSGSFGFRANTPAPLR